MNRAENTLTQISQRIDGLWFGRPGSVLLVFAAQHDAQKLRPLRLCDPQDGGEGEGALLSASSHDSNLLLGFSRAPLLQNDVTGIHSTSEPTKPSAREFQNKGLVFVDPL